MSSPVLVIIIEIFFAGTLASTKSAPYFIEEPSDTYVKKGRPAELKCQVGGNPKPSVMWKRDGNKLDLTGDSRRMIKPDGSLYFSEIIHNKTQKPDEGTYQCEAFSQISNLDYQIASRTARLIVAGKSKCLFALFSYFLYALCLLMYCLIHIRKHTPKNVY